MPRRKTALLVAILIGAVAAAVLVAMGRDVICTCGSVDLWVGERDSSRTSQMIADWYSLSHIAHGLIFYAALWLVARNWPVSTRFLVAMAVEATWEVAENTPWVIDRYRETTAALGYTGDSVVNSMSDIAMMALGFLAARKLPLWGAIFLLVLIELIPLLVIRDNLTLNVWMLLWPNDLIGSWQADLRH